MIYKQLNLRIENGFYLFVWLATQGIKPKDNVDQGASNTQTPIITIITYIDYNKVS